MGMYFLVTGIIVFYLQCQILCVSLERHVSKMGKNCQPSKKTMNCFKESLIVSHLMLLLLSLSTYI